MSFLLWSLGVFVVGYVVGAYRWQKLVVLQLHNTYAQIAQTDRLVAGMKATSESLKSPFAPVAQRPVSIVEQKFNLDDLQPNPVRRRTQHSMPTVGACG